MRWASVFLLAGCSLALEDYGRAAGKATCERARACLLLDSSIDCDRPGVWSESRPELLLLAAGDVGYSAERAAACIERIRTVGCTADAWQTEECQAAFPGKLSEGAPCGGRFDACAPGLVCSAENRAVCGSCKLAAPRGATPDTLHLCGRGLHAQRFLDGGVSCVPRSGSGGRCRARNDCLEWMSCVQFISSTEVGTCSEGSRPSPDRRVGGTPGQTCGEGFPACQPGLRCVNALCASLGALESACASDEDCLSSHCLEGACASPRGVGESCTDFNCADGFSCEFDGDGGSVCATLPCP